MTSNNSSHELELNTLEDFAYFFSNSAKSFYHITEVNSNQNFYPYHYLPEHSPKKFCQKLKDFSFWAPTWLATLQTLMGTICEIFAVHRFQFRGLVQSLHKGPKSGYYPCEIHHKNQCHFPIVGSIVVRNWGLVFQKTYGLLRNWDLKNGHFCLFHHNSPWAFSPNFLGEINI